MKRLTEEQIKGLKKANILRFTDTGKESEILNYIVEIFNNELTK